MNLSFSINGWHKIWQYYAIQTTDTTLINLLILSACISFIIAIFFFLIMPQAHRQNKWFYIVLITSSGTFIPIIGAFFMSLTLYLTMVFGKEQAAVAIKQVEAPSFSVEEDFNIDTFGEGSARTRMKQKHLSNEARTQSLVVLGRLNNSEANKVIQESMNDNDDQIRLLAFALLDNKERKIYEKIHSLEDDLQLDLDEITRAEIHSQLAFNYWEIIYLNLASGELYQIALNKAQNFAENAVKTLPKHANLWVLLGRIYLTQKKHDKALATFQHLQKSGQPHNTYAPYLAELYFINRHFNKVLETLSQKTTLKYIPIVAPIIEYWCPHE